MTTYSEIERAMHEFNGFAAPGSECCAWGDYCADLGDGSHKASDDGMGGISDNAAPKEFAEYWMSVSAGTNGDYDPACGARISG